MNHDLDARLVKKLTFENCNKNEHSFIKVHSENTDEYIKDIHWCPKCGTIRITEQKKEFT